MWCENPSKMLQLFLLSLCTFRNRAQFRGAGQKKKWDDGPEKGLNEKAWCTYCTYDM